MSNHATRITNLEKTVEKILRDLARLGGDVKTSVESIGTMALTVKAIEEDQQHMRKSLHEVNGNLHLLGLQNGEQTQKIDTVIASVGDLNETIASNQPTLDGIKPWVPRFNFAQKLAAAALLASATTFGGWLTIRILHTDKQLQKISEHVGVPADEVK